MVSGRDLRRKLGDRVDGSVDGAGELPLRSAERQGDVRQAHVPDDQQIDIARRMLFGPGNRAMNEGDADAMGDPRQGTLHDLRQPRRFRQ